MGHLSAELLLTPMETVNRAAASMSSEAAPNNCHECGLEGNTEGLWSEFNWPCPPWLKTAAVIVPIRNSKTGPNLGSIHPDLRKARPGLAVHM